jgi:hypothetical protein
MHLVFAESTRPTAAMVWLCAQRHNKFNSSASCEIAFANP